MRLSLETLLKLALIFFFPLLQHILLFGVTAKLQVSPELCKPARAVRKTPFLPLGAGIGRCVENPSYVFALCADVTHPLVQTALPQCVCV